MPAVDEIGLNPGAIHALWTLHGLGALDGSKPEATAAVTAALKHKSPGVRRNAAAVLPRTDEGLQALLASGVINDGEAQVRLAALLALAEMPANADAAAAIIAALSKPENVTDRWIPDAATAAAAAHALPFLKAVAVSKTVPAQKTFDVVAIVAEHYARGGPSATAGSVIAALGAAEPKVADVILAGLTKGWPRQNRRTERRYREGPGQAAHAVDAFRQGPTRQAG